MTHPDRSSEGHDMTWIFFAEVLDDFRRKEATAYQNMRHLVNDVKYVRQHIAKLFELLRQVGSHRSR